MTAVPKQKARIMGPPTRMVVGFCVPLLTTCSQEHSERLHTVRDSAEVVIVENRAGLWEERDVWRISEHPIAEIGTDPNDPTSQLWEINGVTRLRSGSIVVLNTGSAQLKFFDSSGTHLLDVGGPGDGPGEFNYPMHLTRMPGDTLVVLDSKYNRTFFEPNGTMVRRVGMDMTRWMSLWGPNHGASPRGLFPDGSLSVWVFPFPTHQRPSELFRPMGEYLRVAPDLNERWMFGAYGEVQQQRVDVGGRVTSVVPPFAAWTTVFMGGNPSHMVIGDNATYEVGIFGLNGGLETVVRRIGPRTPILSEEVETWKAVQRGLSWTRGRLPELERAWSAMTLPESKPAFQSVLLDSENNLWVRHWEGPGLSDVKFDVYDQGGRMLGEVRLPPGLKRTPGIPPVEIGEDYFLGVWVDDLDVEAVRLYGLSKTNGSQPR